MNLGVVTVSAEDARVGQKTSPNVHHKSSHEARSETSALDLEQTEWRLEIWFVLLEPAREGEWRHIYRSRVWKGFKNY